MLHIMSLRYLSQFLLTSCVYNYMQIECRVLTESSCCMFRDKRAAALHIFSLLSFAEFAQPCCPWVALLMKTVSHHTKPSCFYFSSLHSQGLASCSSIRKMPVRGLFCSLFQWTAPYSGHPCTSISLSFCRCELQHLPSIVSLRKLPPLENR